MGSNPIFGTTQPDDAGAQRVPMDRSTMKNALIALATGTAVLGLATAGRAINGGLIALLGDNVLTGINLALATFVLENAVAVFIVVAVAAFALGVIESRRDADRP
jgi:hypothetical protein